MRYVWRAVPPSLPAGARDAELVRRWRPELLPGLKKDATHLALDDIRDSIRELRYYREYFIRTS